MTRIRKEKVSQKRTDPQVDELPEGKESPTREITDDLLDEIEDVLEENAAEFVAAFRQQGGQ